MALKRKQRRRLYHVLSVGKKKGATREQLLSAIVTHRTESNYGNPAGGHGTSKGWRQQISGAGVKSRNRTNIRKQAGYYFDEARGKRGTPGQISHAVQRSAYPHKASDPAINREAKEILKAFEQGKLGRVPGKGGSYSPGSKKTTTKTVTPGVDNSALRRDLKLQYLAQRGRPDALLSLAAGLKSAGDVPAVTKTTTKTTGGGRRGTPGGKSVGGVPLGVRSPDTPRTARQMQLVAEKQSRARKPYQWGGGHGSKHAKVGEAVDCSGYVSMIVGVRPRVSGDFVQFGKPGRGKVVTIFSNPGHVIIKIGKRWYGTSSQNPGGGAGRIKPPSAAYLAKFRASHPRGM